MEETTQLTYNLCVFSRSQKLLCQQIETDPVPDTRLAIRHSVNGVEKLAMVFNKTADVPDASVRLSHSKVFAAALLSTRNQLKIQLKEAGDGNGLSKILPNTLPPAWQSAKMLVMTSSVAPKAVTPLDIGDDGDGDGDGSVDTGDDGNGGAVGDPGGDGGVALRDEFCAQLCYAIYDSDSATCRSLANATDRYNCWVAIAVAQGQCLSQC